MKYWLIEPRDPVLLRDGRPFDATPGARAVSLPFPAPSTVSGAVRTRAGGDPFDASRLDTLREAPVVGPILAALDDTGQVSDTFLPAPSDMLAAQPEEATHVSITPLRPAQPRPNEVTNMPSGLHPLEPLTALQGKPPKGMPTFWASSRILQWLTSPVPRELDDVAIASFGISGPALDERAHVALVPGSRVGRDGALFSTQGRAFEVSRGRPGMGNVLRLALLVATGLELRPGLGTLGGEGRVVAWRPTRAALPECPTAVLDGVARSGRCRLLLATPGVFRDGFLPRLVPAYGVTPRLSAAAVKSPITISGFDMAAHARKATRRLAPAGSVYFVELEGSPEARREWVARTWLESLAEDQYRLDGFGVALVGVWGREEEG